ncbi:hypothetical protein SLG_29580 [Sphingobium sp. SYK-6]|uniref:hypothetical protein n=1 Tax=Sphingobium sp. (strain NBRC 103272 / SYK-6) TaxID=627192 RepID=UPI00022772FA|nr:hypothetical protein [Sphingobium sp. SYK-6]BAK67633.1 hypothetical protein SLG_29580 [Sphingobium sp. SYK-6]
MFKIQETTGLVVADDTKSTITAIDRAILCKTRLASSIIEASEQSGLPMAQSQKLLEGMARGFDHLVAGRGDMLSVVRHLTAIKGGSSLKVVDFGCPDGLGPDLAKPAVTIETARVD